ncbi:hypothetical protein [Bacillus tequilensis]|uniref:hypothetical protein n=1 Tax=Bacillus tequilensis TaxID=227866 RepID=UPI00046686A5|nr:hypothetical protein [Bacillus tequilensis]MDR4436162.1 hypothetical protein [Bacillus tequilensis]SPT93266.1 Uncharacterised protein [Bacillus tequilensis]
MTQSNYMNVNDVYPILDLINRKLNQGKGVSHQFESPLLKGEVDGSISDSAALNPYQWQVESFQVERDTSNIIDPRVIKKVFIVYRNGAIDTISLVRGLDPPVPETVPDHEYINNLMIVQVDIATQFLERTQGITANIVREGGYGDFKKVDLTYYEDNQWIDLDVEQDYTETFDDPNEFYDGGGSDQGYDTEVDEAEDYADTEYLPEDDIEPPENGWADGFDPSEPEDIPLDVEVEVTEDFAGSEYEEDLYEEFDEEESEV